ncbi:MAG: thioredoxin domain-containing protein [Nevskiaceae bacterium]|nr:MAG: thioredoxin domain-containing protein [Nevskiaceae bacterium]TBR74724.1 MAG: thioredoxin domain-containing protein [Nevskiaceae bacterium]
MNAKSDFNRNRLGGTSSPYLRQHADNPVHWQPWEDAVLAHAHDTDTPILLSIGYSACHWCHVMAHESFENAAVAAVMNRHFVNIKLDREQRPDIDHVYQLAYQALNQRGGGWPLTMFLDPADLTPFFAGTYFPPTPRGSMPGFADLIQRVRSYFDSHRNDLRQQGERLRAWLASVEAAPVAADALPSAVQLNHAALEEVTQGFDPQWGGSRGGPKFPRGAELEWLLDQPAATPRAHVMAFQTLETMAQRGLQDHLGGGFFRYCVDENWTIPHFEKMLYDNAQLLPVYARMARAGDASETQRRVAQEAASGIATWLAARMTAPDGAFYSSLDADSEGAEGRYYLWTREAFRAAVPPALVPFAEALYGLDTAPNFEGVAWHLLRAVPLPEVAANTKVSAIDAAQQLTSVRTHLLAARDARTSPGRDDKILTAWNAAMISALHRSARLLEQPALAVQAERALDALQHSTWIGGQLYANAAPPAARIPGFLDDHALLLDAILESAQQAFNAARLSWAAEIADALIANFVDAGSGALWLSSTTHATPLLRGRTLTDDTLPNGTAVAIRSLLRLGYLTGQTRYLDAAQRALHAAADTLAHYPHACPTLLRALAEHETPRSHVVVSCTPQTLESWARVIESAPSRATTDVLYVRPEETDALHLPSRNKDSDDECAWLCSGQVCRPPANSPAALAAILQEGGGEQ